jgi:hypothetical protein
MQRITKPNLVMAPESYIAIILYKHLIQIPKRLINDPRDWLDAGRNWGGFAGNDGLQAMNRG